jgi:hypothetical protein
MNCGGRLVPLFAFALVLASVIGVRAQGAKFTVLNNCTAFAFSPDGNRIVYAAQRFGKAKIKVRGKEKKVPVEHDDIWEVMLNGRTRRLVDGSKLIKGPTPVSYAIQAIRIAPDNQHMTVQMTTKVMTSNGENAGQVKSTESTDLMTGDGKEIDIAGTKNSLIEGGVNAAWLSDGQTVVYTKESPDSLLYTLAYVRPTSGVSGAMLAGHYYAAVAWNPAHNVAAAIERDQDLSGPIRLVWIDLIHQTERTLATLKSFNGHLTVSPSATKVAYFRDGDTIEIRSVTQPNQVTQIKVPYGRYEWSADGTHLMLKRGPNDQSNQLIWISLPSGQYADALDGLLYHNFHISPDGQWVAVTEPGEQIMKLFPIP